MIVTVTLNPAVDKTVRTDQLDIGGLNRVREVRMDAGGKGINVSRAVSAFGGESIALGFLGGAAGASIRERLGGAESACIGETPCGAESACTDLTTCGIRCAFTEIAGETRTNLKVVTGDGIVTEINEPGPVVTERERAAFLADFDANVHEGDTVILSGSVPRGVPDSIYAELIRRAHSIGASAFLDADGELFVKGIEAKPDLVKPNLEELAAYCREHGILADMPGDECMRSVAGTPQSGQSPSIAESGAPDRAESTPAQAEVESGAAKKLRFVQAAGRALLAQGIGEVIVSMGADGAVFFSRETMRDTEPDAGGSGGAARQDVHCIGDRSGGDGVRSRYVPALSVNVLSTVGAGDTMTAAYALGCERGMSAKERIRFAAAAAAGAVMTPGTNPPDRKTVEELLEMVQMDFGG